MHGNVNDYEILLLLDAELPDERQEEIVSRARDLIERGGGRMDGHDAWGRRKLAYEIDRKAEGSYHLLTFAAEPAVLDEASRVLKITDGVLRHLAVRQPRRNRPTAKRPDRAETVAEKQEVPAAATEAAVDSPEEAVSAGRPDE